MPSHEHMVPLLHSQHYHQKFIGYVKTVSASEVERMQVETKDQANDATGVDPLFFRYFFCFMKIQIPFQMFTAISPVLVLATASLYILGTFSSVFKTVGQFFLIC